MATIVLPSDFTEENDIPDKDIVSVSIQNFITKYQPIFLKELLGTELFDAYTVNPTDQRFTDLLPYIKPALVDYVYWFYIKNQATQMTGTGAAQSKKQNAVTVSPYPEMVRAWNEMVDYNKGTNKFLSGNATYPEYTFKLPEWFFCNGIYLDFDYNWYEWYGCNLIPTIYQFKNSLGI